MNELNSLYYKLPKKDQIKIDKLVEKAKSLPRERTYTLKFISEYMWETFKDFSYDTMHDELDMLETLIKYDRLIKCFTEKSIQEGTIDNLIRILRDFGENCNREEIKRFKCLMKKEKITILNIKKEIKRWGDNDELPDWLDPKEDDEE